MSEPYHMARENHFQEAMATHHEIVDSDEQPWKSFSSSSSSSSATALESINDCFECNICLEHAQDPVVTLCGHLYCWPCMYKWLHVHDVSSSTPEQYPQCPVCKAEVSQTTLVPLYGRGNSLPQSAQEKKGLEIPHRPPPAPGVHALITTSTSTNTPSREVHNNFQSNPHHQHYYSDFYRNDNTGSSPMFTVSGTTNAHPMIGMFGEMVYARMFGNATEMGLFGHPNSYYLMSSSNPRVRRQEMKAEKSLNRISIFLFCCVVLCLLSF